MDQNVTQTTLKVDFLTELSDLLKRHNVTLEIDVVTRVEGGLGSLTYNIDHETCSSCLNTIVKDVEFSTELSYEEIDKLRDFETA